MGLKWSEGNGRRRYHGEGEVNGCVRCKRCVGCVAVCLEWANARRGIIVQLVEREQNVLREEQSSEEKKKKKKPNIKHKLY